MTVAYFLVKLYLYYVIQGVDQAKDTKIKKISVLRPFLQFSEIDFINQNQY
jgi:hypothetical protein